MRRGALGLVAALVPGGVAVAGVILFDAMYRAARTGIAALDRWQIRGAAVLALLMAWRFEASPAVARAFVAGVIANEGAYVPTGGRYPLGDVGHRLGPAVGPGQVLAGLHLRRLGYSGDPLDLAREGNEIRALYYAAVVFREAFEEARGHLPTGTRDERLRYAIRRYNGHGDAAEKYATRAWERIAGLGGLPA